MNLKLISLTAVFCLISAVCVGTDAIPAHTPFVTVVLRNFDAWDTDHDGVLSADEIERAVRDPSNHGDDAAAAASIKLLMRSKKIKLPAFTRDYLLDYDRRAAEFNSHHHPQKPADAVSATVDTVASGAATQPAAQIVSQPPIQSSRIQADFDLYFQAGRARIAKAGHVLLPGTFDLEHTRQGPLGDCFLVSSVSSLAYHDPDRFHQLITPQKDGTFVLKLPTTQPITVTPPTDGELATSGTTEGDGAWLAIVEQAYGKYRALTRGESEDVDGTDLVRTGGDSMPTIHSLTGHKAIRFSFGKTIAEHTKNADQVLPKLRRELVAALADHRVITAGVAARLPSTNPAGAPTAALPHLPPDILSNHVYAVLNYDPATDVVEIWNPHGQHFEPRGPAGLSNGYPTEHGRFKLPLTEAFQFFSSFTFETASP
jgi:hypothetical protein